VLLKCQLLRLLGFPQVWDTFYLLSSDLVTSVGSINTLICKPRHLGQRSSNLTYFLNFFLIKAEERKHCVEVLLRGYVFEWSRFKVQKKPRATLCRVINGDTRRYSTTAFIPIVVSKEEPHNLTRKEKLHSCEFPAVFLRAPWSGSLSFPL